MPKIINIDGVAQQQDQLTENSNITEENKWEDKIYEIDEQDYVHGGVHGFDNISISTYLILCQIYRIRISFFANQNNYTFL